MVQRQRRPPCSTHAGPRDQAVVNQPLLPPGRIPTGRRAVFSLSSTYAKFSVDSSMRLGLFLAPMGTWPVPSGASARRKRYHGAGYQVERVDVQDCFTGWEEF